MSRTQQFVFGFDLSVEFLATEPEFAAQWIEAQRRQFAAQEFATGPRGGTYRLMTPPEEWRIDTAVFWHPGTVRYVTRRSGRYVRRRGLLPDVLTYTRFTIPVRNGVVILPSGARVETASQFVDVPLLSSPLSIDPR